MKTKLAVLFVGLFVLCSQPAAAQYPVVTVTNKTLYAATVEVAYATIFCSNDVLQVPAARMTATGDTIPGKASATSRGVCLVTGLTAMMPASGKSVNSYSSPGTSYSQFIIQAWGAGYKIDRDPTAM